jgi:hypothetical protein
VLPVAHDQRRGCLYDHLQHLLAVLTELGHNVGIHVHDRAAELIDGWRTSPLPSSSGVARGRYVKAHASGVRYPNRGVSLKVALTTFENPPKRRRSPSSTSTRDEQRLAKSSQIAVQAIE